MSDKKVYFHTMVNRVSFGCSENQTIVDKLLAFKNQVVTLNGFKTEAEGYFQIIGDGSTNEITIENTSFKMEVSNPFSIAASLLGAYGTSVGNPILINMKHYTYNVLFTSKPQELKTTLAIILKAIDDFKIPLAAFGFDTVYVAKLIALDVKYSGSVLPPQNAIEARKIANELLDTCQEKTQIHLATLMDPTAEFFKMNDNAFYLLYRSTRKVTHHHMHVKVPIAPTSLTGNLSVSIMDKLTGMPKQGVTLSVLQLNYIGLSTIDGETNIIDILPGTYAGKLSCTGCVDIDFNFTIVKGEETLLGFMMEASA